MTRPPLAASLGATVLVCACTFNTSGYSPAPDLADPATQLALAKPALTIHHGR